MGDVDLFTCTILPKKRASNTKRRWSHCVLNNVTCGLLYGLVPGLLTNLGEVMASVGHLALGLVLFQFFVEDYFKDGLG